MALQVKDFTFAHIGRAEGMGSQRIFSISQTENGAIWWSSMTDIGRYNGSKVRNYRLDENTPYSHLGGRVINLAAKAGGSIYAFDNRGSIYHFCATRDRFELTVNLAKKMGHDVALNDIHEKGDNMWLAMHDGVYLMQGDKIKCLVKGPYVNCIVPMGDRLLFCTRKGVYDEKGHRLLPYNIESGYYDELSGKLWLGGYENGLHLVAIGQNGTVSTDEFVFVANNYPLK